MTKKIPLRELTLDTCTYGEFRDLVELALATEHLGTDHHEVPWAAWQSFEKARDRFDFSQPIARLIGFPNRHDGVPLHPPKDEPDAS